MRVTRDFIRLIGLAALVGLDLIRPSRPAYRMPARWLAR